MEAKVEHLVGHVRREKGKHLLHDGGAGQNLARSDHRFIL
jgi:hypothetical protein